MKKIAALALIFLAYGDLLRASAVTILSPDTAQTYAFSTIIWKQLRWAPGAGALVASITFSNFEYATRGEPRVDERFDFEFPGITFDRAKGVFYARNGSGGSIPVAEIEHTLFFPVITLLPEARISIYKRSGKVKVELTADSEAMPGERWVEKEEQEFLPGL